MDPTLEEKQNNESQQKRPAGESAINNLNNLFRARSLLKEPLGKVGTKAATQTALRGFAAFLASPVGLPIAAALIFILVFTIIIVMGFGGAPSSQNNGQEVQVSITPSPTAP